MPEDADEKCAVEDARKVALYMPEPNSKCGFYPRVHFRSHNVSALMAQTGPISHFVKTIVRGIGGRTADVCQSVVIFWHFYEKTIERDGLLPL